MRSAAAVRTAYGIVLLLAPERLLALGAGRPVPRTAITVARILGARHLLQAALTAATPTARTIAAGVVIDGLHGASGIALAVASRRWRGIALADATLATSLAAASRRP